MATTTSRQETGGARRAPGHEQKEKTMIFHINRATYKAGLSEEQRRAGVEMLRQSGAGNPAVKSYVVGPELGGEFEYGAVYVFEDLDGYWAYLNHPAHVREELWGIPHLEKFAAIDVSDSDDPELGEKIAARCRPATSRSNPSWPRWWPRRPRSRCPTARDRPPKARRVSRRSGHVAPQR
jgi:Stress responsive A/B Barrel Domain